MNPDTPLRILYVLPYVPSPIRVRPFQIIRSLARLGHRVTVVALEDEFITPDALRELEADCEKVHIVPHSRLNAAVNCLFALPTPTPLWAAYCRSPRMARLLQTLVGETRFDVAHVEHLRAAHFAGSLGRLPRVLDAVDCITALQKQILDQGETGLRRLLAWEEWAKLRTYEPRVYRGYGRIAVTSAHDASALVTLEPTRLPPVEIIPNGVDLDYFQPVPDEKPEPDCVVLSGKMGYIANADAARFLLKDILPRLRQYRPGVRVILAGSNPPADLKALAQRVGNVTVTGFVEDLRPCIRRASVAICPMRIGVGIQNKALEAMALGRPVVASPLVARAILGASETGALRIAETADEFAAACALLLTRPNEAKEAGEAARNYVERNHRWESAARKFVEMYVATQERATRG